MIYLFKISIPLMCSVTLCYLLNFSQEIWDVEPFHTTVVEKVPRGEINWLQEIYLQMLTEIFSLLALTCLLDFWCCLNKWSNIAPYSSCIRCISLMCSATFSIPIRASIKCWCSSEFGSVKFCNKEGKCYLPTLDHPARALPCLTLPSAESEGEDTSVFSVWV